MDEEGENLTIRDVYVLIKKTSQEQIKQITGEFNKNFNSLTKSIADTNEKIEILNKKYLSFERYKRKNNLVIFGLPVNDADIVTTTITALKQHTGVDLEERDINNIYFVGKKNESKAILVQFVTFLKKLSLLKNATKLKGTGISMSEDLCPEDRERHRILVKYLKEARERNLRARIRGDKLEVEGQRYTVQELEGQKCEDTESGTESEAEERQTAIEEREAGEAVEVLSGGNSKVTTGQAKKKRKRTNKNSPPFLRSCRRKK